MSSETFNILFVCSGNSCRTPMAEGLMRAKIPSGLAGKVEVASAGTLGIYGAPATDYAVAVTEELGADITDHLSQGISAELAEWADIIFGMSFEHQEFLLAHYPRIQENVFLLRSFDRPADPQHEDSISDPIGGSLELYQECCQIIDAELERILPRLLSLIEGKVGE